jgi:polysaccharide export outer membrane protein
MRFRSIIFTATLLGLAAFGAAPALAASGDSSSPNTSVASVSGDTTVAASAGPKSAAVTNPADSKSQLDESYKLGPADKIRLSVFGETDLGGEFEIDGSGDVRLPLIGQVKASGLTVRTFEEKIVALYEDGYLKDPRISVEVINYRPFYIIGEVNKPGQYPYVSDMNALNAVALAGGYTPKADKSEVYIQRSGIGEKDYPSNETTKIRPGDVVRIPERFF